MLEHTMLPTTPGAIIGYRKSGKPIRLIAGGAPEGGEGGDAAAAGGDGGQAGAPQSQGEGEPQGGGNSAVPDPLAVAKAAEQKVNPDAIKVDQLPDWAQKIVRDARKEAGDYRAQLKAAQVRVELAQQIGKALGLVADEQAEKLTPEQVIEKLTAEKEQTAKERDEERDRHRRALVHLAVHRQGAKMGADSDALLDSRSFMKKTRDLDPDTDDFSTALGEIIQLALDEHPKYKAGSLAGPPTRSGGEFAGGPGARPTGSEPTIEDFRKSRAARKSS
jgi:hypothetical protein